MRKQKAEYRNQKTDNRGQMVENRGQILSEDEIRHIGKLANLSLTDQEVKKFQKQLTETLDYVAILSQLKTDKVKPTSQVTGLVNIDRSDLEKPSINQEQALSGTKSKYNGHFKVKAVLEK